MELEPLVIHKNDTNRIKYLIDSINIKILDNNPSEKLVRQYNYVKKLVGQLRSYKKIQNVNETIVSQKEYKSCVGFLNENIKEYPIKISSLSKEIKSKCGIRKIKKEIEDELKDNPNYKLITKHNTSYVDRI